MQRRGGGSGGRHRRQTTSVTSAPAERGGDVGEPWGRGRRSGELRRPPSEMGGSSVLQPASPPACTAEPVAAMDGERGRRAPAARTGSTEVSCLSARCCQARGKLLWRKKLLAGSGEEKAARAGRVAGTSRLATFPRSSCDDAWGTPCVWNGVVEADEAVGDGRCCCRLLSLLLCPAPADPFPCSRFPRPLQTPRLRSLPAFFSHVR